MIENLDVVVSFRSTHNSNRYHRGVDITLPLVLIGYDSRVDKFSKVKNMFGNIHPGGTTLGIMFRRLWTRLFLRH